VILALHFIFSAYGFWLPNDPRGSWRDVIREFELLKFGPATKVRNNEFVAHKAHDRQLRLKAKESLRYKPVRFNGQQALAIAQGFESAQTQAGYHYLALAILPDHVHLLMKPKGTDHDRIARHLKSRATRRLSELNLHPFGHLPKSDGQIPTPWGRNHWAVFVSEQAHLKSAVSYIKRNPVKHGFKVQRWKIVEPL